MRRALAVGLVQAVWLAGLVVGGGFAAPAAAQENPFTTSVDVRMGERLFRAQCGRCHGRDATGNDETGAPDLTTGTFANASSDAGLFDVIRDGIDGTAMIGISPRASDQTVWQIISYVNSLNLDPEDYELPGRRPRRPRDIHRQGELRELPHGRRRGRPARPGPVHGRQPARSGRAAVGPARAGRGRRPAVVDDPGDARRRLRRRGAAHERGHVHGPHHGRATRTSGTS